ncbi:MAG: hypothetical protein ACUVX8_16385, partial [Candidatus Zipacnadales bacterium]
RTLTKSDVDTHLFVSFSYPERVDLTRMACLVIDTWVPVGQQTSNRILVILHEEGGADYIANTGRSLATAGHSTSYVGLNHFQLAGWSKDENARLDLDRLTRISIGWGGYLGQAGEIVEFSVGLPRAARRSN